MSTLQDRWTYLTNLSDLTPSTSIHGPWKAVPPSGIPAGIDKPAFRAWCADPKTNHVFYMPVIGLVPGARISKNNPVYTRWAFVGDYDGPELIGMSDQEVIDAMHKSLGKKGIMPGWMSRTFSNKVRLVWEFEAPLCGDIPEIMDKAVALFVKESRADKILPGNIDKTSFNSGQPFELGSKWTNLGNPAIPAHMIASFYYKASMATSMAPETSVQIPLEVVMEEIEKQYPGRIPAGKFTLGEKIPLFWINDGNPSEGAWITENGIFSHSDRDYGWKPWGQLLGRSFVQEYEGRSFESVLDNFAYDGNRYWVRSIEGSWDSHPKENIIPRLAKMGFTAKVPKGANLSAAQEAFIMIEDKRRVAGAAPFLFLKEGVVEQDGLRFLNICKTKPMRPEENGETDPAYWPFLHKYITGFLEPDPAYPADPLEYLLSWMKRFWLAALDGKQALGQLLVVAGGIDAGKTLFAMKVLGPMMGGYDDATKFMVENSEFNKFTIHRPVWGIDDAESPGSEMAHKKFTERLKRLVANGQCPYRAMYSDGVTVKWKGRVWLSCNLDTAAREILPNLSASVLDKALLFKANDRPKGFFPPDIEQVLERELPFFLNWLYHVHQIHPATVPLSHRFGVAPFHHHEIMSQVRQMAPEQGLADLIKLWAREYVEANPECGGVWEGTPAALAVSMQSCVNLQRSAPSNPVTMGRYLKALLEANHWRLSWNNTKNQNKYTILLGPEQ